MHLMLTDGVTKLSPNFIFMVIHNEATYILQIDDMEKFKNSDFYNNRKKFKNEQKVRLSKDAKKYDDMGIGIPIDAISIEGFVDLFNQYGISLLRSSNSNKDYTSEDKWHHITKEFSRPRNSKNLISPCNN